MTSITLAAPRRSVRVRVRETVGPLIGYLILAGAVVWMILGFLHGPTQFLSAAIFGLQNGVIYALVALGYTLVYGIIELINFAHGDLFMLGTLLSATIISRWFSTPDGVQGWVIVAIAVVACMAFCATINVLIELFAYRRLRHAPKLAPLITAVGFSFILQNVGQRWNGSGQKSWKTVFPQTPWNVHGVTIPPAFVIILIVTVPLLLLMSWIVARTRQGRAMRATAQDIDAARLMGINVNRTISFTFALGGALAGFAGVMFQQTYGTTRFDLGFQLGLIAFTSAVLGGIGNLTGAVLGGVLIGLIQGLNEGLPTPYGLGQQWSTSVVFSILILLMVFKPEGILGKPTVEKV
jgi:branched-chain amino acid transport system permease protein